MNGRSSARPSRAGRPRTPESAALTGGARPGAEAPPVVRGRSASGDGAIALLFITGFVLLGVGLLVDESTSAAVATMIVGVGVIAIALTAVTGVLPLRLVGAIGVLVGIGLLVSGFAPAVRDVGEWARLTAGAVIALASFGLLFALARGIEAADDPRPGVEGS